MTANGNYDRPVTGEGIQAHHIGNHWVLSSSIGGEIKVYDPLNTNLSTSLRHQIVDVYSPLASGPDGILTISVICPQKQNGSSDCGLFTIGNMFALALGEDLCKIRFHSDRLKWLSVANTYLKCVRTTLPCLPGRPSCDLHL